MNAPATSFAGGKPIWSAATAHQPHALPIPTATHAMPRVAAPARAAAAPATSTKPKPKAKPRANVQGNSRGLGKEIDVANLKVVSAPPPAARVLRKPGKYDAIFSKLTMNHAVECKPDEIGALSNSMRDWFKKRKIQARPRAAVVPHETTGQQVGRVWMIPKKA